MNSLSLEMSADKRRSDVCHECGNGATAASGAVTLICPVCCGLDAPVPAFLATTPTATVAEGATLDDTIAAVKAAFPTPTDDVAVWHVREEGVLLACVMRVCRWRRGYECRIMNG